MAPAHFRIGISVLISIALVVGFVLIEKRPVRLSVGTSIESCISFDADPPSVIMCTRNMIRELLRQHTTKELIENISVGDAPKYFGDCHQIGHLIGEQTYVKVDNVDLALAQCPTTCANACTHGVIGAAVDDELEQKYSGEDIAHADLAQITEIGARYCERIGLCHAMGHVLFIASNDFSDSLKACDEIAQGYLREGCYQGVFMQGVGGIMAPIIVGTSTTPLNDSPEDNYARPCDTVSAPYSHACFLFLPRYQDAIFLRKNIANQREQLSISVRTCNSLSGRSRSECFEGIGRAIAQTNIYEGTAADALALCNSLPTVTDRQSCVLGKVNLLTLYDDKKNALDFCATTMNTQTICYGALFQFYEYVEGRITPEICALSQNKQTCRDALKTYGETKSTIPDYRYGLFGKSKG